MGILDLGVLYDVQEDGALDDTLQVGVVLSHGAQTDNDGGPELSIQSKS